MEIEKEKAVCFTGYRTSKMLRTSISPNLIQEVFNNVERCILHLYRQGRKTYISGMSEGFDMLAAEAVLKLRQEYPDIKLIAVIPFIGQESSYSEQDKIRYDYICKSANNTYLISEKYYDRVFLDRNDYMLDHSSAVICYYNGQRGGTMYTFNRAVKRNMFIMNLCM